MPDDKKEEIETTVDTWSVQIPNGAGKWEKILGAFQRTIATTGVADMEYEWRNTTFTPTEAIMNILKTGHRPVREVFAITMTTLPGYAVLLDAQDYGKDLVVLWKVIFNRYRLGFVREFAHDQGWLDAKNLPASKEQDLNALKMVTKAAIEEATRIFANELDEDFSQPDERSRGIESWDIGRPEAGDEMYPYRKSIWYALNWAEGDFGRRAFLLGQTLDDTATTKCIWWEDRNGHFYVIGGSGTGKSYFLESLIAQDIDARGGFGVIDPHGDLVRDMKSVLSGNVRPSERTSRVVIIDPTDPEYSVCLNPLEPIEGIDSAVIAGEVVNAFEKIWEKTGWGARLQEILKNSLIALIENNLTLREVPLILNNPAVRRKLLANVQEELCLEFFEKYEKWSQHDKIINTESTLNKLDDFLANPKVRDIFNSPKSTFSIRNLMDEGKILLVNLDVGQLKKGASDLLGSLIMSKIQLAAFSRSDTDERKPFYLYVDEFQNFADKNFVEMLDQSRKYGLYLTLAHQNLAQLDGKLRASILSNCKLMACFQVSRDDAEVMAKELYGGVYNEPQAWEARIQGIQKFVERQFIFKSGAGGIIKLKTFDVPPKWQFYTPHYETKEAYEKMEGWYDKEEEEKLGSDYRRKRSDIRAEYKARREALGIGDEPEEFRRA